jgi:capsule polysaccharide export protein KpsE/RkpR
VIDSVAGASHAAAPPASANLQARAVSDATAALRGQIQQAQLQLNDWLTCVSSTTPKGQAAIRSLSAQISSAKQQILRLQSGQVSASPAAATRPASAAAPTTRLDVWA